MSEPQIIFREATTADELHELFCLRKRIYLKGRLPALVKANNVELDLECWDRYSHHMGLYLVSDGKSRAIGYQRGVIEELGPERQEVESLVSDYPDQEIELFRQRVVPFPCLEYLPDSQEMADSCKIYRDAGIKVGESTRFGIDAEMRSLRLSLFFVKCVISRYMFNDYLEMALITVNCASKRVYVELGFSQPHGFEDRYTPLFDRNWSPLSMVPEEVSPSLAHDYRGLANEFRTDGCIHADETTVRRALRMSSPAKLVA